VGSSCASTNPRRSGHSSSSGTSSSLGALSSSTSSSPLLSSSPANAAWAPALGPSAPAAPPSRNSLGASSLPSEGCPCPRAWQILLATSKAAIPLEARGFTFTIRVDDVAGTICQDLPAPCPPAAPPATASPANAPPATAPPIADSIYTAAGPTAPKAKRASLAALTLAFLCCLAMFCFSLYCCLYTASGQGLTYTRSRELNFSNSRTHS
jgi:hypothetical protein